MENMDAYKTNVLKFHMETMKDIIWIYLLRKEYHLSQRKTSTEKSKRDKVTHGKYCIGVTGRLLEKKEI